MYPCTVTWRTTFFRIINRVRCHSEMICNKVNHNTDRLCNSRQHYKLVTIAVPFLFYLSVCLSSCLGQKWELGIIERQFNFDWTTLSTLTFDHVIYCILLNSILAVSLSVCLFVTKVYLETWFQRFYRGNNSLLWFRRWSNQQHVINIFSTKCHNPRSQQVSTQSR